MDTISPLQAARLAASLTLPNVLAEVKGVTAQPISQGREWLKELFPNSCRFPEILLVPGSPKQHSALRVGVVLSGGQAPGGHNVIAGLFDALKALHPDSSLIGFLGGPSGVLEQRIVRITDALVGRYRNLGGFDMIGSGRTKIETQEQLAASLCCAQEQKLDGLVIVGGDDSNTNAAFLAEYFLAHHSDTAVIGVPKTIDGDLKGHHIEISFGHDTACRIYSEMIGNLMRDALSARKYYHFVRVMGRSASHITLECALQTHPNVALIGEEVHTQGWTLREVVEQIAQVISDRAERGRHYGVVLIPEGLIEFVPEVGSLINELNELLSQSADLSEIEHALSQPSANCFKALPPAIRDQLLLERDPHGNVQVSRIETEKLLMQMVTLEMERRKGSGSFRGKFGCIGHFYGYEGRSGLPSHFDMHYCYALGYAAALLVSERLTGYMASIQGLCQPISQWQAGGIPITSMMRIERRSGKDKAVIQKALVDLQAAPFQVLQQHRASWAVEDLYRYPGPIQFAGKPEVVDQLPISLVLENQ